MFNNLFKICFGRGNITADYNNERPLVQQEAVRQQILLNELDGEVKALMEHYNISADSKGQSGTTTLSEIGTVVYRKRRRADAYTKVLNELYLRTGYRLEIINKRTKNNENHEEE